MLARGRLELIASHTFGRIESGTIHEDLPTGPLLIRPTNDGTFPHTFPQKTRKRMGHGRGVLRPTL
jgi:hypothetical protein